MTAETVDLEPIVPPSEGTLVVEGIPARVRRIRAREVFSLARVVSDGLGPALFELDYDVEDKEALKTQLIAVALIALPQPADTALVFFADVVEPVDPNQQTALREKMLNPDVGDLMTIVEIMVDQEWDSWFEHLGKARALANRLTVLNQSRKSRTTGPAGRTPGPSTSSRASTAGRKTTSST